MAESGSEYTALRRRSMTSQWLAGAAPEVDDEPPAPPHTPLRLIIQKEKPHSYRVPAVTFFDIFAYYRAYMMSAAKHLSMWVRYEKFNQVVQQQVFYGFGGGLAVFYIHMFLGVYVPEQHFFIAKMAPLLSGIKFIYVIAGIFELTRFLDISLIYLDFYLTGLFLKNSWNSCQDFVPTNYTSNTDETVTVRCITTQDFYKSMLNESTLNFVFGAGFSCFHNNKIYCWQVPQILLAQEAYEYKKSFLFAFYFFILWGIAAAYNKSLLKKYIWRCLTIFQFSLLTIYSLVLFHLMLNADSNKNKGIKSQIHYELQFNEGVKKWENFQNDISVFVQVPPVIHVLTAQSSLKARPSRDSAVLLATNALYFMFNVFVAHSVICYCETVLGLELTIVTDSFFLNPILYFWFIYFEQFKMSLFLTLCYLLLAFIHEMLALIITFQCLVEVVTTEFKKLKRGLVVVIISIFGYVLNVFVYKDRIILHTYVRGALLLLELAGLFALYPLRRFLDDIAFHYGVKPSYHRYLCLFIFPVAVAYKFHFSYQLYLKDHFYFLHIYWISGAFGLFVGVPLVVGMVYYLVKNKKLLKSFCPNPKWGPKNFVLRQTRKLYDGRYYVASQAPRVLSRYMLRRAEPESYKLDVAYCARAGRTTHHARRAHTGTDEQGMYY